MVPGLAGAELTQWRHILHDLESGPRADERRSNMSLARFPAAHSWGHRNPVPDA